MSESKLSVPDITGMDTLTSALAYADAGWFVGPVKRGSKRPGSLLGHDWPRKTTRSGDVIVSWFAGTDHGVFLHPGRSGAVVFDVDRPDNLHPLIAEAVVEYEPPWQNTRPDQPGRRHYVFRQPRGRRIGNGLGRLASGWGEVRGTNGCIIVAPSLHENADSGARYEWGHVGDVPVLPPSLAEALDDSLDAEAAVSDEQITAFLVQHSLNRRPEVLEIHVNAWLNKVEHGESRHDSMTGHLAGAMKEARLGLYPAKLAADTLESVFLDAVQRTGHGQQGGSRSLPQARSEWRGLLAWAVAQAEAADLAVVQDRVGQQVPDVSVLSETSTVEEESTTIDDADELDGMVRRRFPRLDLAALLSADRPPREWVVGGLVPAGASVALVAPGGSGKSLMLLASMIAVARGDRSFAGLPVTKRRVLLVDAENTEDDLADRLAALGETTQRVLELDDLVVIHLPPLAPLDSAIGAAELAAILRAYEVRRGDVVVLDSLQRVTAGPENDSDTLRAYYRHTGSMLKRMGLTVIRTDNTGKDVDKGARGTSGKRDDVDVELLVIPDAEKPGLFRIKPGKVRLPGIEPVLLQRAVDDDTGLLTFTTAGDPFRAAVTQAADLLEQLGLPIDAGERKAAEALKQAGHKVLRNVLRVALKERRMTQTTVLALSDLPAPSTDGAPFGAPPADHRADAPRRTPAQPVETGDSEREHRAEPERRTNGAVEPGAQAAGAPPLPLYKKRRTGAHDPLQHQDEPVCGTCNEPLGQADVEAGTGLCGMCELKVVNR